MEKVEKFKFLVVVSKDLQVHILKAFSGFYVQSGNTIIELDANYNISKTEKAVGIQYIRIPSHNEELLTIRNMLVQGMNIRDFLADMCTTTEQLAFLGYKEKHSLPIEDIFGVIDDVFGK